MQAKVLHRVAGGGDDPLLELVVRARRADVNKDERSRPVRQLRINIWASNMPFMVNLVDAALVAPG